jgi:hypothetical protein
MAPLGPEDPTTVHVGQPGFFSLGYTLCGRKVSRRIHISSPSDVTCRGCKRRWELAAGARELPRPAVNEITNLPPQNVTARMSR